MKIGIGFLAGLLTLGLAFSANAGSVLDGDSDGVPDAFDNCVNTPNGPSLATASCNDQEDDDNDGFGNPCDGDLTQDGNTLGDDFSAMFPLLFGPTPSAGDLTCDGSVLGDDFSAMFPLLFTSPGD
jgi:hypothetical protein